MEEWIWWFNVSVSPTWLRFSRDYKRVRRAQETTSCSIRGISSRRFSIDHTIVYAGAWSGHVDGSSDFRRRFIGQIVDKSDWARVWRLVSRKKAVLLPYCGVASHRWQDFPHLRPRSLAILELSKTGHVRGIPLKTSTLLNCLFGSVISYFRYQLSQERVFEIYI